jgi:hypothetical protein
MFKKNLTHGTIITNLGKPTPIEDAITKEYVDKMFGYEDPCNSIKFIEDTEMDEHEPNGNVGNTIISNKVMDHKSRMEINGYDLITEVHSDEEGNQKITFTIERGGEITEKELRFFEVGIKKSIGGFDPERKRNFDRPYQKRTNDRPYSPRRPHPNYANRYGNRGWNDDFN